MPNSHVYHQQLLMSYKQNYLVATLDTKEKTYIFGKICTYIICTWMMTWGVWIFVFPLSILTVSLVQSSLLSLGVLLLPSLLPAPAGQAGAPLLDLGHATQLLLAELVHLGTCLGHQTLTNSTPVGLEGLGQHSITKIIDEK